ncbi:MAG TPA: OmpA family protein [Stellaceae bacterium]|nr:OmpA family protein [Stellaceae bacterium]
MRFTTVGAAAALLLATMAPAIAQAPPPPSPVMVSGIDWTGFYAGAELGGDWGKFPGSVSIAAIPGLSAAGTLPLKTTHDGAIAGGGQIGYQWQLPSNWVIGGEFDFKGDAQGVAVTTSPGLTSPAPAAPFISGDSFKASSSWNGSARLRIGYAVGPVLPYITGGVAFADVKLTSNFIPALGAPTATSATRSDTLVGWTVGAGLDYALTPAWSLGAEYRYADYGSTSGSLGTVNILGPSFAAVSGKVGLQEHTVMAKLNYHFGAPPPPPPAPMAMPAPPPAAAKVFIVFFDWDKDVVTPEGEQIIEQAAAAYKSGAPVQLQVTGYTDRSGSPGYNQRLSERRANNVAKALAALGVPRNEMAVSGRGENDNRVPTAPGVREPQNRRVEIVAP